MSTNANDPEHTIRTDARLKKAAQVERDKQGAWADIAATMSRVDENTARLKALRIAREQADAVAIASAPAKPAKAPSKRRKPAVSDPIR